MTAKEAIERATAEAKSPEVCLVGSFIEYRATELMGGNDEGIHKQVISEMEAA